MTHYLDIRIRILPEIAPEYILEKLFGKIHLALAERHCVDIGLSFPEVDEKLPSLGLCLRLHGPEASLRAILERVGLASMRDYLRPGEILPTPAQTAFRRVNRVQVKSSIERLRRRLAKRHGLTHEEAAIRIPESVAKRSRLPFIRIHSKSSGQDFPVFIRHGPIMDTQTSGAFSAYGLSIQATIPWF